MVYTGKSGATPVEINKLILRERPRFRHQLDQLSSGYFPHAVESVRIELRQRCMKSVAGNAGNTAAPEKANREQPYLPHFAAYKCKGTVRKPGLQTESAYGLTKIATTAANAGGA